jgi:hypothetical protein
MRWLEDRPQRSRLTSTPLVEHLVDGGDKARASSRTRRVSPTGTPTRRSRPARALHPARGCGELTVELAGLYERAAEFVP